MLALVKITAHVKRWHSFTPDISVFLTLLFVLGYQFKHGLAAHKDIEEALFIPISLSGLVMNLN